MIDRVSGSLLAREPGAAIVDVGSMALRVEAPPTCLEALGPLGAQVTLFTHLLLVGQEAQPRLFGFSTPEARRLFHLLRGVSGIGPAMALRVVGAQPTPAEVATAIARGDAAGVKVKGVGPKIAKRIITELKDKVGTVLECLPVGANATAPSVASGKASGDRELEDAYLALRGLELDPTRARQILLDLRREMTEATAEELVRQALLLS